MINIKIKFKPEVLMDKRFQIVTDSSCDLPQAMADELDLAVLPLSLIHI